MTDIEAAVDRLADETGFSGAVRADVDGVPVLARAYGLAHRGWRVPNRVDTRFGMASGGKGLTALTVLSLVADGALALDTPARSLLGDDLPLIDDRVTVELLLAHRSGIGDYLDEEQVPDVDGYVMPVPVHELDSTESFVRILDGYPMAFPPGERFAYNNGAYVVLALLAERASGTPFHELVAQRACRPAGMTDTSFPRSDEHVGTVAAGYLEGFDGLRTNVMHLPVRGSGDGGACTTVADVSKLWQALFAGRIVPPRMVAEMVRPRSDVPDERSRYGLGLWLHATSDVVMLNGYDAGASFRSVHRPSTATTHTVVSNTSSGAWRLTRALDELLGL
ncbi:MAG: serine hydrolase domain-containing protein [Frankiaceae bacterium]